MKTNKTAWILVLTTLAVVPVARAQESTQPTQTAVRPTHPRPRMHKRTYRNTSSSCVPM
jgi:hypothetical protein